MERDRVVPVILDNTAKAVAIFAPSGTAKGAVALLAQHYHAVTPRGLLVATEGRYAVLQFQW